LIRIQQMKGNRSRQIRVNHAYLREDLTSWRLYEGERELAVAQFAGMPRRLRTLSGVVAAAPIKLDIENFRCTMCAVSDWHNCQRAAYLSLEALRWLIDEQIGLVERCNSVQVAARRVRGSVSIEVYLQHPAQRFAQD
jgi:hypothetical protein